MTRAPDDTAAYLRAAGLSVSGSKAELARRLQALVAARERFGGLSVDELERLSADTLRGVLRSWDRPATGDKRSLASRIRGVVNRPWEPQDGRPYTLSGKEQMAAVQAARGATRANPLEAPRWMSREQARVFLALPGADARMMYVDQLRNFARRNPKQSGVSLHAKHIAQGDEHIRRRVFASSPAAAAAHYTAYEAHYAAAGAHGQGRTDAAELTKAAHVATKTAEKIDVTPGQPTVYTGQIAGRQWASAKKKFEFKNEAGHVLVVLWDTETLGYVDVLARATSTGGVVTVTETLGYVRGLPGASAALKAKGEKILRDAGYLRGSPRDNPRVRKLRGGKRKPFQAQEILLERGPFTLARARNWLRANGHKYGTITESEHFFHARQFPASDYQKGTLHNVAIAKHVEAIVGIPKSASDAADKRGYDTRGPRQGRLFTARPGGPVGDVSEVLW